MHRHAPWEIYRNEMNWQWVGSDGKFVAIWINALRSDRALCGQYKRNVASSDTKKVNFIVKSFLNQSFTLQIGYSNTHYANNKFVIKFYFHFYFITHWTPVKTSGLPIPLFTKLLCIYSIFFYLYRNFRWQKALIWLGHTFNSHVVRYFHLCVKSTNHRSFLLIFLYWSMSRRSVST